MCFLVSGSVFCFVFNVFHLLRTTIGHTTANNSHPFPLLSGEEPQSSLNVDNEDACGRTAGPRSVHGREKKHVHSHLLQIQCQCFKINLNIMHMHCA